MGNLWGSLGHVSAEKEIEQVTLKLECYDSCPYAGPPKVLKSWGFGLGTWEVAGSSAHACERLVGGGHMGECLQYQSCQIASAFLYTMRKRQFCKGEGNI